MFKLGVAASIRNPRFYEPRLIRGFVYRVAESGVGMVKVFIYACDSYQFKLNNFLKPGDKIRLTSNSPNFYGMTENCIVRSIVERSDGSWNLHLSREIKKAYLVGDQVELYGTGFGGSWKVYMSDTTYSPNPYSNNGLLKYPKELGLGRIGPNAQIFKSNSPGYDSFIGQRFRMDSVVGRIYRFGYWGTLTGIGHIKVHYTNSFSDNIGNLTAGWATLPSLEISNVSDTTTDWVEKTRTVNVINSDAYLDSPFVSVYFEVEYTSSSTSFEAGLSEFFIEHASGTDDASSGVYTFDTEPDQGVSFTESKRLSNYADGNFYEVEKYSVRMMFSNVDKSFRKQLQILSDWQEQGNFLILHLDEKYYNEYPASLIGTMNLSNVSKEIWNPDKVSFNLTFEEA